MNLNKWITKVPNPWWFQKKLPLSFTFSIPSSTPSSFPGTFWVTTGSKPEFESTSGVDGEETEAPVLLHAQFGNLWLLYHNTETLLPFELKIGFWLCGDAADSGDVVVKGIRTNVCDSFMVNRKGKVQLAFVQCLRTEKEEGDGKSKWNMCSMYVSEREHKHQWLNSVNLPLSALLPLVTGREVWGSESSFFLFFFFCPFQRVNHGS